MKGNYSGLIFTNKSAKTEKATIKRLENEPHDTNINSIKAAKERYVQAIIGVPEFDQAFDHLSQHTMELGTQIDKENISTLANKIKHGDIDYEDVITLEGLCNNTFKHFFTTQPEKKRVDVSIWGGFILAVCAIILRVCYEIENNFTLMVFLAMINIIGVSYTLIGWPEEIAAIIEAWLFKNNMHKSFVTKITSEIMRKTIILIAVIACVIVTWMIISWLFNIYVLGNDIVSIVSLVLSVLSQKIVSLLARHFEWSIYHNNN